MELLIAGVYAVSKKIKTEKAIKKKTKRQAYEDRYKELMEEHDQFHQHQQQQRRRTETEIGVRNRNDDEDERVERSQSLNLSGRHEDQVETGLARSQTWTGQGQGHVSDISGRTIQGHKRRSTNEDVFNSESQLQTKKASIKTRQEYSSDDRSHDDDDNDDVDGPTRWVNDVVLERTRSLPEPLRIS